MSFIRLDIEGAKETAEKLGVAANEINDAAAAGLMEGMLPITESMRFYPPRSSGYSRTGNYGARISTPQIQQYGGEATGYIESTAPYNVYVAGMPDGGGQAWMHQPFWSTLLTIITEALPKVQDAVNSAIERLIGRLGL